MNIKYMKKLIDIKNKVAKNNGYLNWTDILINNDTFTVDNIYFKQVIELIIKEYEQTGLI